MNKQLLTLSAMVAFAAPQSFGALLTPGTLYDFEGFAVNDPITTANAPITSYTNGMSGIAKAGNGGIVGQFSHSSTNFQGVVDMQLSTVQLGGTFTFDLSPSVVLGTGEQSRISVRDSSNFELLRIGIRDDNSLQYFYGNGSGGTVSTTIPNVFTVGSFSSFSILVDTATDKYGFNIAGNMVSGLNFRADTNALDLARIEFRTVNGSTGGDTIQLDNISFTAVPEPNAIALFVAGLVCLVVLRRRRLVS